MPGLVEEFFAWHVRFSPLDSVNLVFRAEDDDLKAVLLVLDGEGWSHRWMHMQGHQRLYTGAGQLDVETAWRVRSLELGRRDHVRLWSTNDLEGRALVAGSAHRERLHPGKGHAVLSFNAARDAIAGLFADHGWSVTRGAQRLNHSIDDLDCDGDIVELRDQHVR